MDTIRYLEDPRHLHDMAGFRKQVFGKEITHALKKKIADEIDNITNNPKRDDTDLKNDLVYRLGCVSGIGWVLKFLDNCENEFNSLEGNHD